MKPWQGPNDFVDNIFSFPCLYIVIPSIFVLGWFLQSLPAFVWLFSINIHEIGHAVVYLLASWPALPVVIWFQTFIFGERSLILFVLLSSLWGYLIYRFQKTNKSLSAFSAVLLVSQVFLTFLLPKDSMLALARYGGFLGEMLLSALLIIFPYYFVPNKGRKFALLLIFAGSVTLPSAFLSWIQILLGSKPIPYGSVLDLGLLEGKSNGDVDVLFRDYHWTPDFLIKTSNIIAIICLTIVVCHLLYGLVIWVWGRKTESTPLPE